MATPRLLLFVALVASYAACSNSAGPPSASSQPQNPLAAAGRVAGTSGTPPASNSLGSVAESMPPMAAAGTRSATSATAGNAAQAEGQPAADSGMPTTAQIEAGAGAAGSAPSLAPVAAGSGAGGDSNDPDTVTVQMDEFTVEPHGEVFMCQDFDNPFGGVDVAVARSESIMSRGSHHLHVYYGADNPPTGTATPCPNPNEFRPMIHLATIPHQISQYPTGMAAKLKGNVGLRFMAHYLNQTDEPLHANVQVKLTKIDPAQVTQWVAQMHFNRIAMSIRPGSDQQVTTSCTIPSTFGSIGLINAVSHMHRHGVHFVARTSTGIPLLDTTDWDEAPPAQYDTPVMLNPGDAIEWTCTYENDTPNVLSYGDSADKNEMCIYIARFFSSPDGDDLECETPFATATARSTKNVAGL